MLNLWLPEEVADEFDPAAQAGREVAVALQARKELQRLDARLDLIWVKETSTSFPDPGRWHIVRFNEGVPPTYWAWCTPDGEYLEPMPEQMVRMMQAKDISRGGPTAHQQAVAERERRRIRAEQNRRALLDEVGERLNEQIRHAHDVSVSVPKAVG